MQLELSQLGLIKPGLNGDPQLIKLRCWRVPGMMWKRESKSLG